jgi:deoxyadenosine/deoxycytidine kinase
MYKIALCGAHGTGKTTLLKALNKELGLTELTGVIRSYWKDKTVSDFEKLSPSVRAVFQKELLLNQIQAEDRLESFVTDRSVIDYAAHTENDSDMSRVDKQMYFQLIQERVKNYTQVIYLKPMFVAPDENLRADMQKQSRIAEIMYKYGKSWTPSTKFYEITQLDLQDRVKEVLEFLGR